MNKLLCVYVGIALGLSSCYSGQSGQDSESNNENTNGTLTITPPLPVAKKIAPTDYTNCVAPQKENERKIPQGAPPNATYIYDGPAPLKFRGDADIQVKFRSVDEINKICTGVNAPLCGYRFYACVKGNVMYLPNPCQYPDDNPYTSLLCHEIAHVNGWPAWHGF